MAQQGVEQVGLDKHNLARTGRMALYGGCACSLTGPSTIDPQLDAGMQLANTCSLARRLRPRRDYMVQLPRPSHQLS